MSRPQTIPAVVARLEATRIEIGEIIAGLVAIEETRAAGARDVATLEAYANAKRGEREQGK